MENTIETPVVEVTPINHESNRLGELIISTTSGEKVYQYTNRHDQLMFFAWGHDEKRGFMFKELDEAANFLGIIKPTGYADYNGTVRLGKCVEKFAGGEIWKYADGVNIHYYVWQNGSNFCNATSTLIEARKMAQINTASRKKLVQTKPKSENPQNRPGYRADNISAKKAKG